MPSNTSRSVLAAAATTRTARTSVRQEEIASSGVDAHDFGPNADWETAEFICFDVAQNVWHRTRTSLMLAPVVLHVGKTYGIVYIKRQLGTTENPKEVNLLAKKPLPHVAVNDLYDGVKRQQVCAFCSVNFRKVAPDSFQPHFVDCNVANLRCRAQSPLVRIEEVVPGKVVKRKVALTINSTPQERSDAHKLAAFQFFTYTQSKQKFVVVSLSKIGDDGDHWTEPIIHSVGKSLGDVTDGGDEGVTKWKSDFTKVYSGILQMSEEELFALDTKTFCRRLFILGCFEVVQSPIVWKPSAPNPVPDDDKGVVVPKVHSRFHASSGAQSSDGDMLGAVTKPAGWGAGRDECDVASGESQLVKMSASGSMSKRRGGKYTGRDTDIDG